MKKIELTWLAVGMTAMMLASCANLANSNAQSGDGQQTPQSVDCVAIVEKVLPSPGIRSEADSLIEYYLAMRKVPKERALKEYTDANRGVQTTPNSYARIKLALLLSLPITGLQDSTRALNLLQDVNKEESQEELGLRNFANLLHSQLYKEVRQDESLQRARDDQKRLEALAAKQDDAIQALNLKLKDEQKRYDTLQSSIQTKQEDSGQVVAILTQKLKDEQKRADTLQQKLDALTNIEKAIIERQQQGKPDPKK
jgi:hypothetical protein